MIYKLAVPDSIIITSCEEFNAQHFNISLVNKEIHNECMPIFDHEVAITVRLWNQTEEDYACVLKWLLNMTDTRCSRMRTVNFVLNTIFRINVLDVQNRIFVQHVDGRRFNFPRPTDDVDPQRYIPMTFRVEKRRFAGIDKMLYGITPAAGDSGLRVNHLANVLWYVSYHQDAWGESYPLWDQLLVSHLARKKFAVFAKLTFDNRLVSIRSWFGIDLGSGRRFQIRMLVAPSTGRPIAAILTRPWKCLLQLKLTSSGLSFPILQTRQANEHPRD